MNRRVYETVARKRACEGPLEAAEAAVERQIGSKGWHTRGYLPHYDKPGVMQMLTFHSGEDRRVKKAFAAGCREGLYAEIAQEVIRPTSDERHANPRSAPAKLRWARKAGGVG
jgi:16S rRNA (cytosine1402-N4)-methyltransferase